MIESRLKHILVLVVLSLFLYNPAIAQKEIKHARKGNREYRENKYDDAELLYRRSFDENPNYSDAIFNLGDALYKQEKYGDAMKNFESLAESELDPEKKSATLYNLANSLLKDNKLKESIEAYKKSLRLKPGNMQAKHNLAYAQDKLKEQEEQEKQEDQDNKDKDKEKEEQDKNEDNQDEGDDNKDKQDDQNQDKEQEPEDQNKKEEKQNEMSKEDIERLLEALAADEQAVQDKVKKAKASKKKVRTLKNW